MQYNKSIFRSLVWDITVRISNSLLMVNGKSPLWERLFSKCFVNVNIILNFKKEMYIPFKLIPKEDTLHRWRFCWLVIWQKVCWPNFLIAGKVAQIHVLRQERATDCSEIYAYTDCASVYALFWRSWGLPPQQPCRNQVPDMPAG